MGLFSTHGLIANEPTDVDVSYRSQEDAVVGRLLHYFAMISAQRYPRDCVWALKTYRPTVFAHEIATMSELSDPHRKSRLLFRSGGLLQAKPAEQDVINPGGPDCAFNGKMSPYYELIDLNRGFYLFSTSGHLQYVEALEGKARAVEERIKMSDTATELRKICEQMGSDISHVVGSKGLDALDSSAAATTVEVEVLERALAELSIAKIERKKDLDTEELKLGKIVEADADLRAEIKSLEVANARREEEWREQVDRRDGAKERITLLYHYQIRDNVKLMGEHVHLIKQRRVARRRLRQHRQTVFKLHNETRDQSHAVEDLQEQLRMQGAVSQKQEQAIETKDTTIGELRRELGSKNVEI
ncbi:uncharacterized protein BDZ99DRAFT_519638 [Mytilinidion resinicola]|uniref:Uncharacterized protein n=1 Tax=Mytilinidion resinicola TaxID=574789 RepID=A0A6A6YQA7_9PEZI|nr:uncharacterized protein BDZ99DRAFT_519638 [Mytilinidion resinicola]KAF2810970.1 hypothetical protein BDZ99DRAFT_519638 [Mytilinidion resinicola]